ncbi:NrdH-redoxin [Candidatus Saccharibacteria bacterium]|nr:NrdH-redoxin [Candidatus Saccharibacteria bacterium]
MAKVKIYSTTTCPYCKLEKEYLKSKGVEFEDVILDQHPEEIQASIDTCGSMGVPCTHITKDDGTEEQIAGFNKPKIDAALGLS